ncbi:MAG: ELM1/GtrOC1 family putative glycosyltransferase [Pseudomonadota bacterium]
MPSTIWRFTDGKAGHDSQSVGLCRALNRQAGAAYIDIPVTECKRNLFNILFKRFPFGENLSPPDIVMGAGHATHLPMLAAARFYQCKSILLMKPGLPTTLFDFCLIPKHDKPRSGNNIIPTNGALNDIQANKEKDENLLLILLGGHSRHVKWEDEIVIKQIRQIVEHSNQTNIILIGSRRTPEQIFNNELINNSSKITVYRSHDLPRSKLINHISKATNIWITIDSISMIYESLSSGANVGLIDMKTTSNNKINKNTKLLIDKKLVITVNDWLESGVFYKTDNFNEAERCAELLIQMKCFE